MDFSQYNLIWAKKNKVLFIYSYKELLNDSFKDFPNGGFLNLEGAFLNTYEFLEGVFLNTYEFLEGVFLNILCHECYSLKRHKDNNKQLSRYVFIDCFHRET